MNCPHCQKELPENYDAAHCPFCAKDFSVEDDSLLFRSKIKASWIMVALLLPPCLTVLSAALMNAFGPISSQNEPVSPLIGFFGGIIGGLSAGILLALKVGKTHGARVVFVILFSILLVVVCVTLCLIGCNLGGYHFRIG